MTNDEIIKFLQSKQLPQCGDKEYTADEEYEAYQRAIDAIEQTTWIPVSERLPKLDQYGESDYILLSFENFSLPLVGRYQEDEDGDGNFYEGDDDEPLIKIGVFVNAWMPLVKCYEG